MASNKRLSVQTRSITLNPVNTLKNDERKQSHDKKNVNEELMKNDKKSQDDEERTMTPTTTVTTNSFFYSSVTSTTATTISTKQYNYYSNLISNTLISNSLTNNNLSNNTLNNDTLKNVSNLTSTPKDNALSKDLNLRASKNSSKDSNVKTCKTSAREVVRSCRPNDKDLPLESPDKNFSSVLKGNYTTYRKKYLEGPVVGIGSFGVVKTLFSMVEILDLYQYIPTRLRPPINNLSKGIKRLSENSYEFCGIGLRSPTRAAKIMNFERIKKTGPKNLLHILREISIGSWNDHPNIVKVKEIYLNEEIIKYLNNINTQGDKELLLTGKNNNVYLVMEYCSGGDLSRLIINEVNKENMIPRIFVQIFRALSYINSKGIAHRDVKPENFLLTHGSSSKKKEHKHTKSTRNDKYKKNWENDDIVVKLADFGLANSSARLLKTRAGTPYYVAPEIIKCNGGNYYGVKCDSWSAGIMLHIFLLGTCPFHDESDVKKLSKVVNEEIDWTHEIYATIPPEAYDLLKKLLVKNPSKRISTTDSLKHVYFQKFTGYVPMYRNINGILVIDKLIQFYKFPVLKQVALCIMIRQLSEYKLADLSNLYKFFTSFSQDFNSLNIGSLTKYTNYHNIKVDPNMDIYNQSIDKLYHLKQSLNVEEISYTEFLASQMATELCQNNDLIANVFAGLHSDLPGRRSLFIYEQDLARLTTKYTHDYSYGLENKKDGCKCDEHMNERSRINEQILRNVNTIMNDACEYADNIYVQNKMKGTSDGLAGFIKSSRGTDKVASMSIDEFFLMMSFTPIKDYKIEDSRQVRIKRKKIK